MLGNVLRKLQPVSAPAAPPANDFSEAGLRKSLFSRMEAFEKNGGRNFSYFYNEECWGVDLARNPLFLLWDGDPKHYLTMRYFLAMYDIRGLVGGGLHIAPVSVDDFKRASKEIPDLVAVIFGGEDKYEPLCRSLGIPFCGWKLAGQYAFPTQLPQMCAPYLRQNLAILDQLGDEWSRKTLLATQLYRVSLEEKWLSQIICGDWMYFQPGADIFTLDTNEIFIDAGGSLGDTVAGFSDAVKGSYKHIHSFEPSPIGAGIMRKMFNKNEKITVYELGLSNSAGVAGFSHQLVHEVGTVNGVINRPGADSRIMVEALDNLNIGKVTFIKMDIEGFEQEALEGARKTIKEHKPKLAICTYHKPEDFGKIFNLIKNIREDYTIYLRHYSASEGDSVFYAV